MPSETFHDTGTMSSLYSMYLSQNKFGDRLINDIVACSFPTLAEPYGTAGTMLLPDWATRFTAVQPQSILLSEKGFLT
jgi:hypothetical protein